MANTLTIEGKEYVPATVAGKHFGYTKDYLLMLIKEGKIEGQKIGNKWYVHIPSAEEHFSVASKARELRRREISLERKAELRKSTHVKKSHTHATALVETLVIVIIGLSLGATGYVGSGALQYASVQNDNARNFFENVALSMYSFVTPAPQELAETVVSEPQSEVTQGVITEVPALIVAPASNFSEGVVNDVRESFSDPVDVVVDPEDPDTGIITPIFKDGKKGDEYRFLMVPVNKN
jgi:hypothetical protein